MKKILNGSLILGLLLLASLSVRADQDLYIIDTSGKLGTVDLTTDVVSVIGNTGQPLSDIAFTANGNLYGTTYKALYSLSLTTGAASIIGSYGGLGANQIVSLVGNSTGGLYASSFVTSSLYAIDVSPFSITALKGSTGGPTQGDLTFGANGTTLYDSLNNGKLSAITIGSTTITSSVFGATTKTTLPGLVTESNGVVLGISGTEIYMVDTSAGTLTPLFNYGGHGLGVVAGATITSLVSVPEPGNVAMLILGISALIFYQSRKRANA